MFIDFTERSGRERERRNIDVREKHLLVASHIHPDWGWNLQFMYVPWPGIEPTAFWCTRWCSNHLSHLARTHHACFTSLGYFQRGNFRKDNLWDLQNNGPLFIGSQSFPHNLNYIMYLHSIFVIVKTVISNLHRWKVVYWSEHRTCHSDQDLNNCFTLLSGTWTWKRQLAFLSSVSPSVN